MTVDCPYCDQVFESEHEKGVHISEEHTESGSIAKKTVGSDKHGTGNSVVDKWERESRRRGGQQ